MSTDFIPVSIRLGTAFVIAPTGPTLAFSAMEANLVWEHEKLFVQNYNKPEERWQVPLAADRKHTVDPEAIVEFIGGSPPARSWLL